MVKGILKSGFEFEIDVESLDDMEFVEALADAETNALAFPRVCKMMLGEEQKKRLYDHLRDENGRVPVQAVQEAIIEIMSTSGDEAKNS